MFKISRRKRFLSQCVLKLQNVSLQDVLDACKSAWVQKSTITSKKDTYIYNYIKERHFRNCYM